MQTQQNTNSSLLERLFAILAAIYCLVITILLWVSLSAQQSLWPLPALYFIELTFLSITGAMAFMRWNARGKTITWAVAGTISAFSFIAILTVGLIYQPIALIFAIISLTFDVRNKQPLLAHLGVFLLAGVVQAAIMFAVIWSR
jgi:hypothetical protein